MIRAARAATLAFRLLALAVAGANVALAAGPAGAAPEPFQIDVIESLTGPLAFIGQAQTNALQALADYVNATGGIRGRPLKFVVADDQSTPQMAVQLLNDDLAKHPAVVLGAGSANSCNAMFPLVAKGPVLYCLSNAVNPAPGGYAFSADVSNEDQIVAGLRYFGLRGWTRIATLTATDSAGSIYDHTLDRLMALPENKSLTLVDREHLNPSDISATAQIARIKASGAQVLLIGSTGTAFGTALRAVNDVGLAIPIATGNGNATYAAMNQYAQFLPKDFYFLSFLCLAPNEVTDPATKAALRVYFDALTKKGMQPDGLESSSWDPGLIVVSALRKLGTDATADQLRDYIANLKGFRGANGIYDFPAYPQRGVSEGDVIIAQFDAASHRWFGVSKPGGIPVGR